MRRSCKFCGSPDHTKFYCRLKPRRSIARRKRIRRYGKHAYLWDEARRLWIEQHGPEHPCHYCGIRLTDNDELLAQDLGMRKLTLDHIDARSNAPELRYVERNLIAACAPCNRKKGSKSHDRFPHICYSPLPAHATVEHAKPPEALPVTPS